VHILYSSGNLVFAKAEDFLHNRFSELPRVGYQGAADLGKAQGVLKVNFGGGYAKTAAQSVPQGMDYAPLCFDGVYVRKFDYQLYH
jgi:hypothetical protein